MINLTTTFKYCLLVVGQVLHFNMVKFDKFNSLKLNVWTHLWNTCLKYRVSRCIIHGFLYNWIGKLFLPSAWLGHSLIFYNFKTIHLKLIKFDENMVLWLVNQNFEKNQVLMYHFSSNACLRKLNLNLREKKSWFSNACNFLRKTFSNLLKHELYFN